MNKKQLIVILVLLLSLVGCADNTSVVGAYPKTGKASWYSAERTATGEKFDGADLTCAMRKTDFGKHYKVCNVDNNKCVVVRQNNFGPAKYLYAKGRVIDLSKAAFSHIADVKDGVIPVSVEEVMVSEQLDEVNSKFTYKGKPIHPFLVGEFSNWLSDRRPPMVTTVDIAAAFDTNKYQQSTLEKRGDWWFAERGENVTDFESFGYHWLGRLANGIHVVEMGVNGGGSGFFMDLMFIKFSEGEIFNEGKKEKQLLMSIAGVYSLGDRYEGEIKVYPNKVFIPASKNQYGGGSVEKDVELKFPMNKRDGDGDSFRNNKETVPSPR